jgi:isoamylase
MTDPLPSHLLEGRPEPMGALARDGGVNFVVFSQHAKLLELCLFDTSGTRELKRFALHGPFDGLWHGFLPGAGPGLVYGLRAHGPHAPEQGHRFNPHKLLMDPCAREIVGHFSWDPVHHGYTVGHPEGMHTLDPRDNAAVALKARVPAPPQAAPGCANRPRIAPADMVLYELHVKGFTMQLPGLPPELRGTYAGLAHPLAIAHFKRLGITTLSLLPVHYHLDEPALVARGQVNYWGYNTLGFFAPSPRLAACPHHDPTAVADEFRQMVATLHAHGLEVVLDVVYNHTAEAGEGGPTISFRGLDHASWYRLKPDDPSHCDNLTGCGNTVNVAHPRVTQFVLDSLRCWVQEMGVDGFRFDLAPVLGRLNHGYDPQAAFFTALKQDPVLNQVHLIAEPWDAGPGGYQVGRFPGRWLEWNDKFRDTMRRYWIGHAGPHGHSGVGRGEFARRFTASSDLFHHGQRRPSTSINFLAVHDGFTLADVVSYATKHNLANGEHNRDGRNDEPCHPFGAEGPAAEPGILALRGRVRRAMLATLVLAQGTPMLCAGDEFGNSQQGNNNAYCQDNPTGWLDWPQADHALVDFVARLLALRASEPALRHDHWFHAHGTHPGERSLDWFAPTGQPMQVNDWHDSQQQALACRINGVPGEAALLLAFNPEPVALAFSLPAVPGDWTLLLDSSGDLPQATDMASCRILRVPGHALVVLRQAA